MRQYEDERKVEMFWLGLLCVIGLIFWIWSVLALGKAADEARLKALEDLMERKVDDV